MQLRSLARTAAVTALAAAMLPLSAGPVAAANVDYVVSPADLNGWTPSATGAAEVTFVNGPTGQPLGVGSVRLLTGLNGTYTAQVAADYGFVELDMLWGFTYDTHLTPGSAARAPRLIFDVDLDANGTKDDTWTFDPAYQAQPVVKGEWQTWGATDGLWTSALGLAEAIDPETATTIFDLISEAPDARFAGPTGIRIAAGNNSLNEPVDANVDNVSFWLGDTQAVYDFEPGDVPPATTVRDMKAQVLASLRALGTTGNRDTDRRVADAIDAIERALDRPNWTDGDRIDGKKADKIFNDEQRAVDALAGIKNPPAGVADMIATLVAADRLLAEVAIADAAESGDTKGVEKAQKELAKGDADAESGKAENAIAHYRNAWKHVGK